MNKHTISKTFKDQTKRLSEELSAMDFTFESLKKSDVAAITTNLSKIEFIYTKKDSLLVPVSTVFVRIYPLKTYVAVFHLYEFMDKDDLRGTYIANIESVYKMELAIDYLGDILKQYLPKIEDIVLDSNKYEELVLRKKELVLQKYTKGKYNLSDYAEKEYIDEVVQEYINYYQEHGEFKKLSKEELKKIFVLGEYDDEEFKTHLDFYEENYQVINYTNNEAYRFFIIGNYAKALKRYNKVKDLSEYEKRLCLYMKGELRCDNEIFPDELISSFSQNKINYENRILYKLLPFTIPVFLVIFGIISLIIHIIHTGDSMIHTYSIIFLFFEFAGGVCTGLFFTIAFRKKLAKFIVKDKDEYKTFMEKDMLYNGKGVNRFCVVFACIVAVLCIYFSVVFTLSQPLLYEDKIIYDDCESFPFLNPREYKFDDLTDVYYIKGRYNDYGDYIGRSSYIFCYKDGDYIDSDWSFSNNQVEEYILPILGLEKSDVEVLESDREFEELTK